MSNLSHEVVLFIRLVFTGWEQYAEAGVTGLLIYLGEKALRKPLSWRILRYVATAFLVFAFFNVWDEQYHRANDAEAKLEQNTPRLIGEILSIGAGVSEKNSTDSIVIVDASIKNLGAQSIADHFSLSVRTKSQSVDGVQIPPADEGIFAKHPEGGEVVFHPSEYLPKKAMSAGIPLNGEVEGFFIALIPGIKAEEFKDNPQTVVILSFRDAIGKKYSVEQPSVSRAKVFIPNAPIKR